MTYSGAPVTQTFRERWLSGKHIGDAKPVGSVEIRKGRFVHSEHPYPGLPYFDWPPFGDYPGALGIGFWFPEWQVNSAWMPLEGVQNIKLDQSFDQNGVTTCTIRMDNIKLVPETGAAGILYHLVQKGYYSPLRGYVAPNRPDPGVSKTAFFNKLPNAQLRIRQGYGADQMVTTFLGLIDDIDSNSQPNELTLTARDFGGVLVDQHFFGWAKEKVLPSPITFVPRRLAENATIEGGNAIGSSNEDGYPADNVTKNGTPGWRSKVQDGPDNTQWIEISIPEGKYSQIYLGTLFANMHVYIGIRPFPRLTGGVLTPATFDGRDITNEIDGGQGGWWDPHGTIVPGHFGGWPYFTEINATTVGPSRFLTMGGVFFVGGGVIRLGFRNLDVVSGGYQAGITRFGADRRSFNKAATVGKYIEIDDLSDIVKIVLRWSGFKTWEVESTGVNLREPYLADQSKSMMDMIKTCQDQTGFTFFMAEPRDDDDDQDLGYPIFRNTRLLEAGQDHAEFIDDSLLLTDAKVKISNANDHCIIRCRGKAVDDGVALGPDRVHRIMFAYIPPWAGEQAAKQAGVLKPLTHTDNLFTTLDDCQFACYLIGIQIAIGKWTAIIDLPANPGIGLDTLQSVIDRVQGLNSRLYITNRTQEMQFGSNGYWTMELGGGLSDTEDMVGVVKDYRAAIKILDRGGKNPWRRKRHGKGLAYGYEDT